MNPPEWLLNNPIHETRTHADMTHSGFIQCENVVAKIIFNKE